MIKLKDMIFERLSEQEKWGISRMEEQFALQMIIKRLIPNSVQHYNKHVEKEVRGVKQYINVKETTRTLRKTKDKWDEKEYMTDREHGQLRFGISKRPQVKETPEGNRGILCIGDWNVTNDRSWYWYALDELEASYLRPIKYLPLREEKRECRVSKVQEQEGLQFIKRFLIKRAVDAFNRNVLGYEVTEKEVANKLKKIVEYRPTVPSEGGWLCDIITYGSVVDRIKNHVYPEGLKFRFDIAVDGEGSVIAGYTTPLSNNRYWSSARTPLKPEPILENKDRLDISKEEENYVLNRIYKEIIPKVIDENYGRFLRNYPKADINDYPRIGYQSVIKNLKKTRRESYMIGYKSKIPNSNLTFYFEVKRTFSPHEDREIIVHVECMFGGIRMTSSYSIEIGHD